MEKTTLLPACCALSLLLGSTLSCGRERATDKLRFTVNSAEIQNGHYHFGSALHPVVKAKKMAFDSLAFRVNQREVWGDRALVLDSAFAHYGVNRLTVSVFYDGRNAYTRHIPFTLLPKRPPAQWSYTLIRSFPHDRRSFTEGLAFQGGFVYESTGGYGSSKLLCYALGAKKPDKVYKLDKSYFGEGLALVGDTLYQLTYKSRKAFLYDKRTFERKGTLPYPPSLREGWGLYYHAPFLLASDGSSTVCFLDGRLKRQRAIQVTTDQGLVEHLNELEVYRGKLYANVWQKPLILVIDLQTGVVEAEINLESLTKKYGKYGVLNGITVRGEHLLVTGKNWDKLFEIAVKR